MGVGTFKTAFEAQGWALTSEPGLPRFGASVKKSLWFMLAKAVLVLKSMLHAFSVDFVKCCGLQIWLCGL